jgi:hypothetical protein
MLGGYCNAPASRRKAWVSQTRPVRSCRSGGSRGDAVFRRIFPSPAFLSVSVEGLGGAEGMEEGGVTVDAEYQKNDWDPGAVHHVIEEWLLLEYACFSAKDVCELFRLID